eukprot:5947143-Alexandrium_andersonii.AAC.1
MPVRRITVPNWTTRSRPGHCPRPERRHAGCLRPRTGKQHQPRPRRTQRPDAESRTEPERQWAPS